MTSKAKKELEFASVEAIDRERVYEFICANVGTNELGHVFSVVFVKRETGELRTGRFRLGVTDGVKGTGSQGWKSNTREGIASHYSILKAYDVDKVQIIETATSRVVATYDEHGERHMARKNPTVDEVQACDVFEAIGGPKTVREKFVHFSPAFHAKRGAFRSIPLDSVLRIRREGETIEGDR